jgi:hypothetical protein
LASLCHILSFPALMRLLNSRRRLFMAHVRHAGA